MAFVYKCWNRLNIGYFYTNCIKTLYKYINKYEREYAYTYPYDLTRDVKILTFTTKLQSFSMRAKFKTWKIKNNNIYDNCESDIDGIKHHLIVCPQLLKLWDNCFNWWKSFSFNDIVR